MATAFSCPYQATRSVGALRERAKGHRSSYLESREFLKDRGFGLLHTHGGFCKRSAAFQLRKGVSFSRAYVSRLLKDSNFVVDAKNQSCISSLRFCTQRSSPSQWSFVEGGVTSATRSYRRRGLCRAGRESATLESVSSELSRKAVASDGAYSPSPSTSGSKDAESEGKAKRRGRPRKSALQNDESNQEASLKPVRRKRKQEGADSEDEAQVSNEELDISGTENGHADSSGIENGHAGSASVERRSSAEEGATGSDSLEGGSNDVSIRGAVNGHKTGLGSVDNSLTQNATEGSLSEDKLVRRKKPVRRRRKVESEESDDEREAAGLSNRINADIIGSENGAAESASGQRREVVIEGGVFVGGNGISVQGAMDDLSEGSGQSDDETLEDASTSNGSATKRRKPVRRRKADSPDSSNSGGVGQPELSVSHKEAEAKGSVNDYANLAVDGRGEFEKEFINGYDALDGLKGVGNGVAVRGLNGRSRGLGQSNEAAISQSEAVPPRPLLPLGIAAPKKPLRPPVKAPSKPPPEPKRKVSPDAVKQKLQQGLAMVSGKVATGNDIDNSIDPQRLVRGELVVHKKVGIGRFRELRSEKVEGRQNPVLFVYLEYADGLAKLPAHQAHRLLYRYRSPGTEGKEPGLSRLKDRRSWEKRKSKGRAHIQKMVINILKLYRMRAAVSRPVYPPDNEAQTRFEAAFRYTPTDHQQQAFDAVRYDMCHRTVPMDRIVCGDVGFGKTEVALRAIFRAANAGRQVAVLAPTTVLAKQHFDVITDRFKDFPEVEIAMFSRLAGDREKKLGLERMANGLVHVAVGTHALLGENVRFKDLGLLVVDEEQRFGVRQKEKMKDMKTEIDVLTLSATPIPRTLEQATRGLKDLSLILTPPPARRPIKTHLQEMDEELITWAIEQELERGGQVYYIVPRIHGGRRKSRSIFEVESDLKDRMPNVNIDMAHGQMSGPELERAMRAFRAGETQILLCTSIVESGLDIPNCNTIIITEVEKFGLAQIYQLRGRVGRSDVEAHAYLMYSVGDRELLSPSAELRLQALEECVDLGSGVNVAQRDLTIRGTGEVFGEKQSGKLSAEIGADLFNEMLFNSLYRAQTETLPEVKFEDVKIDFVVDTLVPYDYIDCTEGRDQVLEDMEKAARGGVEAANEFYLEMEERLGPPPPGAKRRLQMLVMKQVAADLGITRIRTRPKFILFETTMSIGAFQMLFDAIDEEKAMDIKNHLIYKEGSAGFLLKSLLGLPPEKEAQDAFECLLEMSKGLDSFMNLERL